MTRGSLPNKDVDLLGWSKNFSSRINADPESFGVPPALAAELSDRVQAYVLAFAAASAPATRTQLAVLAKNESRTELQRVARAIVKLADAQPGMNDEKRISLGINLRAARTRIAPPEGRPSIQVKSVRCRQVTISVYDPMTASLHRKVKNATLVGIYSYVGQHAPEDSSAYHSHGVYSRSKITLDFPHTVPSGASVWLCARWLNAKGQPGPSCHPILTTIQGGPGGMIVQGIAA